MHRHPPARPIRCLPGRQPFGGLRLVEGCPAAGRPTTARRTGRVPGGARGVRTGPCAGQDLDTPGGVPPGPSPAFSTGRPARGADPAVAWSRQFAQVITEIIALPVAAATRSLDDRTGPESHHPAHPDASPGPAAQDPAHRDIAAGGARGGDDRRAQLRAAVPRAGATPGAAARPPVRARTARPSGPVALHRDQGRLADVRAPVDLLSRDREGVWGTDILRNCRGRTPVARRQNRPTPIRGRAGWIGSLRSRTPGRGCSDPRSGAAASDTSALTPGPAGTTAAGR